MQEPISKRETIARLRTLMDGQRPSGPGDLAERSYGPIVLGLPLSEAQKVQLLRLLEERISKVIEIRARSFNARVEDPKQYAASVDEALRKGTDPIDDKIAAVAGPALAPFVAQLIELQFELGRFSVRGPRYLDEELGEPMSPMQRYKLAVIERHLTEARGRWMKENLPQSVNSHEPIDQTQMTKSEQSALAEMAAEGLTQKQIESKRRSFIFTERGIHGIPIEYDRDCEIPANAERLIAKACGEDGPQFGHVSVTMRGAAKAKLLPSLPYETPDDREYCAVVFESTPSSKSGAHYLMISIGVAIFDNGEVIKIVGENSIVWTEGHPPAAKL